MKGVIPILVTLVGLTGGFPLAQAADHTRDTLREVKRAIDDDKAILLDVREREEWDVGHLKGARLLPLSDLEAGIKPAELAKKLPKGKLIYCHCAAGGRSLDAADLLKKLGYDVRALKPGYKDLLKAGFEKAPH